MNEDDRQITEEKYVRAAIREERGRWAVYLEVGDSESSVQHRIRDYPTKRAAEIAAKLIKRTAERDEPFRNFET